MVKVHGSFVVALWCLTTPRRRALGKRVAALVLDYDGLAERDAPCYPLGDLRVYIGRGTGQGSPNLFLKLLYVSVHLLVGVLFVTHGFPSCRFAPAQVYHGIVPWRWAPDGSAVDNSVSVRPNKFSVDGYLPSWSLAP